MTAIVDSADRTIPAIRKHIAAEDALAGGGEAVCIDKSADLRIVITALEVIESRLLGVLEAKTHNKYWYFYPTRSQRVIFGCAFLPG